LPTTRLDIEYDGRAFAGWARQPGRRTIEGVLQDALTQLQGAPVDLVVAGRTDQGVHATGQVCSYDGPVLSLKNLNAVLPADVAVRAVTAVPDGFDARRDAISRAYRYRILTRAARSPLDAGRSLHHPTPLDRAALEACAAVLPGLHDFRAFTPSDTGHRTFNRRITQAEWVDETPEILAFVIAGGSFLRHMNRVLVGTMLEVARGRSTPESFAALLEGAPRSAAGATAPPHGLCLTGVGYPSD
jgi:tRNA pseudouridine38-40 synthase